jgi:hypothetical protein
LQKNGERMSRKNHQGEEIRRTISSANSSVICRR